MVLILEAKCLFLIYFKKFICSFEREREVREGQKERLPKSGRQPDSGLNPRTLRSEPKANI